MEKISLSEACKTLELYDSYGKLFLKDNTMVTDSYREFYLKERIPESKEAKDDPFDPKELPTEEMLTYYLPRILSISPFKREIEKIKNALHCIGIAEIPKSNPKQMLENDNIPMSKALTMAQEWMAMISPERANERCAWWDIGINLYAIGNGCKEAFDMWLDFSRKTNIPMYFSETTCAYEWNKMTKRSNKGLGILKFIARQDSPEKMTAWCKKASNVHMTHALKGGHHDIALMLKEMYGHTYVFGNAGKDSWYEYSNHRWKKVEGGLTLRAKISTDILPKFQKLAYELWVKSNGGNKPEHLKEESEKNEEAGEDVSQSEASDANNKLKTINKLIANINSAQYKNSVMCEAAELFYRERFEEKLDTNPYLMGFDNGVLDLKEMRFRPGKPEDFITKNTGYDYPVDMDPENPDIMEVDELLNKLFPDKLLKKYFLEFAASLLIGGNASKYFTVLTGEGDNGKSVLVLLLEMILGSGELGYSVKLPTSFATGKRAHSAAASPEFIRCIGVRFATLQEVSGSGNEMLNTAVIKEVTGNDRVYGRGLYRKGIEFILQLKLAMICNRLPKAPTDDQAFWNRMDVISFESTFVDPADCSEDPEEQIRQKKFVKDPFFSEQLPNLKYAFIWMLFEELKRIKVNGRMIKPEKVKQANNNYRKNNDVMMNFLNESVKADENALTTLAEFYVHFKEWFSGNYPRHPVPIKPDFRDDLIRRIGPPTASRQTFTGFRLRTNKDDIEEGRAMEVKTDKSNVKAIVNPSNSSTCRQEVLEMLEETKIVTDEEGNNQTVEVLFG